MAGSRARSVDPLVVGKVIGDVLDMFTPTVDMTVHFGGKQITNGCDIKPSLALDRPSVRFFIRRSSSSSSFFSSSSSPTLFTIVMTDPDAPSPSEPSMREWLHWIVTDVPASGDVSRGTEVMAYSGPKPPIGIHRYVLAAFRQQEPLKDFMEAPAGRHLFSTRSFASKYNLGLPVAAVYFNAQKEPANKKR